MASAKLERRKAALLFEDFCKLHRISKAAGFTDGCDRFTGGDQQHFPMRDSQVCQIVVGRSIGIPAEQAAEITGIQPGLPGDIFQRDRFCQMICHVPDRFDYPLAI